MTPEALARIKRGLAAESEWSIDYLDFGAERARVEALVAEVARLREAIGVALTTLNEFSDDTGATNAREVLVKALEYTDS